VVELLDLDASGEQEQEGANVDLDASKTKCAVIKTSTRATYFLPVVGLVEPQELKPADLVGVNKDSYLILEKLPAEYDSRVKVYLIFCVSESVIDHDATRLQAMEVDERPKEQYSDIGGLDKQIEELIEAVVLPMQMKERFLNLGIVPPKGVLLYGPPGTGTLHIRGDCGQTGWRVKSRIQARPCWLELWLRRRRALFSNWPGRSWSRCLSATAPSWCATRSPWPRRRRPASSSSTSWTR